MEKKFIVFQLIDCVYELLFYHLRRIKWMKETEWYSSSAFRDIKGSELKNNNKIKRKFYGLDVWKRHRSYWHKKLFYHNIKWRENEERQK